MNQDRARYDEVHALRSEVEALRIRVSENSQARLENELRQSRAAQVTLSTQNERLQRVLKDARDQIVVLKGEIERLAAPPASFGVILDKVDDTTVDILTSGRKMRVGVSDSVPTAEVQPGREVIVNEALNVVKAVGFEQVGELVQLKELLDDERLLVLNSGDEERVVRIAAPLREVRLRVGDSLVLDSRTGFVVEKVEKAEVADLVLEEVPDIRYEDIGGLAGQIEQIQDAVELPFLHAQLFRDHDLRPPKGVLLYGPPGCGKTMIAKAVAASLARKVAEREGDDAQATEKAYFLNIKGPELLNKYVGETERHIRLIFQRAREASSSGRPVVVFFDEMESLFRTRGSGVSSDVETTVVPQLLAEIDGVESLENVIVIGASNREDMIDPAILRPGRLDVKIKIERPDEEAAREIFGKYLTTAVPLHADDVAAHGGDRDATVRAMIDDTTARMYATSEENRFLEVTYAGGDKEVLYFKDFGSGAMVQNIVDRAKKAAIKAQITAGEVGIRSQHLVDALRAEFKENEDLPNTTNPDDWARVSGRKGERIVHIRTLVDQRSVATGSMSAGDL